MSAFLTGLLALIAMTTSADAQSGSNYNPAKFLGPSPESQAILDLLAPALQAQLQEPVIFDTAANYQVLRAQYAAIYSGIVPVLPSTTIGPTQPCGTATCTLISAPGVSTNPADGVVMYFHGGAYFLGDLTMYSGVLSRYSESVKRPFMFVDYRLAPENDLPLAVSDGVWAYNWLRDQGVPSTKIAFAGDSAGGGLALLVLQALLETSAPQPACSILMSPFADLSTSGESASALAQFDKALESNSYSPRTGNFVTGGVTPLRSPLVSGVFGRFKGMSPLLVMAGSHEMHLSDANRIAGNARAVGVDVTLDVQPYMFHVYQAYITPEARLAQIRMKKFLKRCGIVGLNEASE